MVNTNTELKLRKIKVKNALRSNSFEDMVTMKHSRTQQHLDHRIQYNRLYHRWKSHWNKHIHAKVVYLVHHQCKFCIANFTA